MYFGSNTIIFRNPIVLLYTQNYLQKKSQISENGLSLITSDN